MRTPATREILEHPAALLTAANLARLGEGLLRDTGFEPTFALDPALRAVLDTALIVVERDVRAAGITGALRLIIPDRNNSGYAQVEFAGGYHGNGIRPAEGRDPQGALASVADATQETITELTWTVWPVCPVHDQGLHAELEHEVAVWRCTAGGTHTVAPVGGLSAEH